MQPGECTASIGSLEDPTTSRIITDNADWLEKITLDSSDYILPSAEVNFEPSHDTDSADEDAALVAHLWDRDHASDLEAYEWNSDDLVSEACSDDGNASEEELPRLARRDEFEQGIRREGTWTREYREQWEEHHLFYKSKIQSRLEASGDEKGDYEGRSCVSESAWSAAGKQGWSTPATSGGGDWTTSWTAGDGWTEWKKEDPEPWTQPGTPSPQDTDIVDEEGSARTNEDSGELNSWKQPSGLGPLSKRTAYKESRSTPTLSHFSKSTHTLPATTSSLYDGPTIANLDDSTALPPPTSSQLAKTALRNPKRTARFGDPEPVNAKATSCSDLALDAKILDNFLDTCIEKTQALLADAKKVLGLQARVEEISEPVENGRQPSRLQEAAPVGEVRAQGALLEESVITPAEIVRVEGWWKVKGCETWTKAPSP